MLKKSILMILLAGLFLQGFSQEQNKLGGTIAVKRYNTVSIEAIRSGLETAKDDTAKVRLLLQLCSYYNYRRSTQFNDLDSVIFFAQKVKALSSTLKYKDGIDEANFLLCKIYAKEDKIPQALVCLQGIDKPQRIRLSIVMGEHYLFFPGGGKDNMAKAYPFLLNAMTLSNELGSRYWKNESLAVLGKYYFENDDFPHGENCFLQIIGYFKKNGDKEQEARWWDDLGRYTPNNDANYSSIITNLDRSREIYHSIKDFKNEEDVILDISEMRAQHHLYNIALGELDTALKILVDLQVKRRFRVYMLMAQTNYLKGDLDKALYENFNAVKNMDELGETHLYFYPYLNIGEIYQQIGQAENSIKYYKLALDHPLDLEGLYNYYICKNICRNLISQKKPFEALTFLSGFVKKHPPVRLSDQESTATAFGDCYVALNKPVIAEKYYLKMIELDLPARRQDNNEILQQWNITGPPAYYTITQFYVQQKQYHLAEKYLEQALTVSATSPSVLKDIRLMEFKIDSAKGSYLQAINSYEKHIALKDSIFNDNKIKQLSQLQVIYETAERLKDISLLKGQKKLEDGKLADDQKTKQFYLAATIGLFGFIGLGYSRYRIKQRNNVLLVEKNNEITSSNTELQRLLRENEWLMKEVHHRVKNNLQIVMSLLNSQSAYLHDEAALNAILESKQRVQAMSLIHQKLYRSANVSHIYMPDYVSELVEYLKKSFKTQQNIRFIIQVEPLSLDIKHAGPLGLILNEAITNSIKYAFDTVNVKEVSIVIGHVDRQTIAVTIADNGKGLPSDFQIKKNASFGLTLITGLVDELGGMVTIENSGGTSVNFSFTV